MNRGLEIAATVADSPRSTIVEQVTNGVTVRMAVLYLLLGGFQPARREPRGDGVSTYTIKGARLLGGEPTDLRLEDGVVTEVGPSLPREGQVVDADGLIALPGLVDLHTHLREPGREDAETVESGTQAAARGGFTAVHAMANTDPVADTAGVVEQVWRLGPEARVRRRAPGRCGHGRPGRQGAGRARRDGRVRRPGPGLLRRRQLRLRRRC